MEMDVPVCIEEENTERILEEARIFAENNKGKALIVFDFDELLVSEHASRLFTHLTSSEKVRDAIIELYGDYTFKPLLALSNLKIGMSRKEYFEGLEKTLEKINFRPNALEILKYFLGREDIKVIVMSSGSHSLQTEFFKRNNVNIPIFACKMAYHKGHVVGSKVLYLTESKALFLQKVKEYKSFEKIFIVGHSKGDSAMMMEGIGIAVNPDEKARKAAKYVVNNLTEAKELIVKNI